MSDTYEATFTWPAGPNEVIITGTFDNWSKSKKLVRSWEGSFSTTLKFTWGSRILFKYIVDGQWVTSRHEKTEIDPNGNVNNLFQVPPKPESTTLASVALTAVETQTAPAPSPKPQPVTDPSVKSTGVTTLASIKDSAFPTEGVHPSNVTSHVASAVGAAGATVTGVDPINAAKIPADEPQPKPTTKIDLDLSPAAIHGKLSAPPRDIGKLPSLLPAAADGKKAVSAQPVEGLPSLIPVASERSVVSPTAKETAPPKPTATAPEQVSIVSVPPTATKPAPEPTTAAKVPEPTKTVEGTKPGTGAPSLSETTSTLKEKVAYGADELGRNDNSTPDSTLRTKKKRGSILTRIKSVFHPDKQKEKSKK